MVMETRVYKIVVRERWPFGWTQVRITKVAQGGQNRLR